MIIIDTPGFGDSKGRDTEHIANMVMNLKRIGYVHTFIITINSQDCRFNEQLDSTIKLFSQMFSSDFFNNVMVCFTKFANDKKSVSLRKKGKSLDKEDLISQMQDEFKNRFGCDLGDDQFAFIDNAVFDMDDDEIEEDEQTKYDETLDQIMDFTMNHEPFFCKDIKEVMKEKDALQKKILELIEKGEQEKIKLSKEFDQKIQKALEEEKKESSKREEALRVEKLKIEKEKRDAEEEAER